MDWVDKRIGIGIEKLETKYKDLFFSLRSFAFLIGRKWGTAEGKCGVKRVKEAFQDQRAYSIKEKADSTRQRLKNYSEQMWMKFMRKWS